MMYYIKIDLYSRNVEAATATELQAKVTQLAIDICLIRLQKTLIHKQKYIDNAMVIPIYKLLQPMPKENPPRFKPVQKTLDLLKQNYFDSI